MLTLFDDHSDYFYKKHEFLVMSIIKTNKESNNNIDSIFKHIRLFPRYLRIYFQRYQQCLHT